MNYKSWLVKALEWEIEQAMSQGNLSLWLKLLKDYSYYTEDLESSQRNLEGIRKVEARAAQRRRDAAEYAEEHDDDYVQAMDEYFDEHNDELLAVPVAGGILQELLTPVFEAFKATPKTTAEAVPVGHSMPESPNGEPLAAVSIRTLLGPDDTNSSKF